MAKKPKTGRRASPEERAMAASLAKMYRVAASSPGGWYYLNPDDEPEFRIVIDINNIDPLLEALENFAYHGTFELMSGMEPLLTRLRMSELRSQGMTYEAAITQLAETLHMSPSTIARRVAALSNCDTD